MAGRPYARVSSLNRKMGSRGLRRRARAALAAALLGIAGAGPALAAPPVPVKAAAKDPAAEEAFTRARAHLDAGRMKEAAAAFRALALARPPSYLAGTAGMLYFEALNRMAAGLREGALDEAAGVAAEIMDLHCSGKQSPATADLCEAAPLIHCDILRLKAEGKMRLADQGGPDARAAFREAGDLYLAVWTHHGKRAEKVDAIARRVSESLYNAGVAYEAAGDAEESLRAWKALVLMGPGASALSAKALQRIAWIYIRIGEYDEGATWLERLARERAKVEAADDMLLDAVALRLGLGQIGKAEAAGDLFVRQYGAKKAASAAQIAFAIGAWYAEHDDFRNASARLSKAMPLIEKAGSLAVRVEALAVLGRSLAALGDKAGAEANYRKVRAYFKDAEAATSKILREGEDRADRSLAKALTALGEAHFFFAEQERAGVSAVRLPAYRGPGDRDALKDAVARRASAIQRAEAGYTQIMNIQPMAPPKWVVAGAAQVAGMWADLADEIRALAGPPRKSKAKGSGLPAELAEIVESPFNKARGAAKKCVELAVKFEHVSDFSRRCDRWLSDNVPKEHPRIEEIAPRIGLVTQGATERPPPAIPPGQDPGQ